MLLLYTLWLVSDHHERIQCITVTQELGSLLMIWCRRIHWPHIFFPLLISLISSKLHLPAMSLWLLKQPRQIRCKNKANFRCQHVKDLIRINHQLQLLSLSHPPQVQVYPNINHHLRRSIKNVRQNQAQKILPTIKLRHLFSMLGHLLLMVTIGENMVRSKWRVLRVRVAITSVHILNVVLRRSTVVIT